MAFDPVTWVAKDPLTWTKFQQMADNEQYLYDAITTLPQGFLAGAKRTSDFTGIAGDAAGYDVAGVSASITLATARNIRVWAAFRSIRSSVADTIFTIRIRDATPATVMEVNCDLRQLNTGYGGSGFGVILTKAAGTYTYNLNVLRASGTGTGTLEGAVSTPIGIYIEDVGPSSTIPTT